MDSYVTGTAIRQLREAKHMTQAELAAVDEGEYFLLVVLLLHLGFLLPFWGHKNTPRRLLVRLLRCIMGRCIQDAADSIHTARIAGGALFGVV